MRISPDDLTYGSVFYECDYGMCIKLKVTSFITFKDNQWTWTAVDLGSGEEVDYLVTKGFEHYGPKLYSDPDYT